ncbi:MAG: MotA/TolQ/ExbB proton channel family protein, partial [Bdellovibrio sp.]
MDGMLRFINDSGVVGWAILLVGVGSLALIWERIQVLYFKFGINSEDFMTRVQSLVLSKKTDEALLLCTQL